MLKMCYCIILFELIDWYEMDIHKFFWCFFLYLFFEVFCELLDIDEWGPYFDIFIRML